MSASFSTSSNTVSNTDARAPAPANTEASTRVDNAGSDATPHATPPNRQRVSDILDEAGRCITCRCTPGRTGLRVPTSYGIRLSPRHHPQNTPPTHNYRSDRLPHPDELKAPPEVSGMKAYHMAIPVGVKAGILTFWVDNNSPWPFWMLPGWHEDFETARYLYSSEFKAGYAALLVITPYDPTRTLSGPRYPPGLPHPASASASNGRAAGPSARAPPAVVLPLVAAPFNSAKSAAEVQGAISSLVAPQSASVTSAATKSSTTTTSTATASKLKPGMPPPATASSSSSLPATTAESVSHTTRPAPAPSASSSRTTASALCPSHILAALDAGTLDLPPKRKRALDPYRIGGEFYFPTLPLSPPAFKPTPSPGTCDDDDYEPTSPTPQPGGQTTLSPYLGLSAVPSPLSFPPSAPVSPYGPTALAKAKKGKGKAVARRPKRAAKDSANAAISSRVAQEMEEHPPTPPKKQRLATPARAMPKVKAESSPESLFTSDSSPEVQPPPFPVNAIDHPAQPMDEDSPATISGASSLAASVLSLASTAVSTRAVVEVSDDETNSQNVPSFRPQPAASSTHARLTPRPKRKATGM